MSLIDIGANLAHESFTEDFDAVLARASAAGVHRMVVTGSDLDSSQNAIALAERYTGQLFATAGLHPHHASDWNERLSALMQSAAATQRIVAVGETGLDYFRDISPRPVQQEVLVAQLTIAAENSLPVFLHQRDAHADFRAVVQDYLPRLPRAVVHCFTDSASALDDYLAMGCYIGVTGWICDERRGAELYRAVASIPDDRLMIETDSPYLMPRTIRPKPRTRRNEPANLPYVLASVAAARDQSIDDVAALTTANAERFFGLATNHCTRSAMG
jgi:TatD DNase family protein